ncbi:MAG: NAD-dependent epimerase/dehydratase family protein [Deltaproteobacteria bacterium]|nr:NAD-dependent epimerase/dehydratase family protein [Deltaproteobacteria bacterium]
MNRPMKVLLTGGTGFLGEYLLADLLERGHVVWALYRSESRKLDTIRFLSSLGLPRSADSLHWFKGELLEADQKWDEWRREYEGLDEVDNLLHSAASTRHYMDENGEPLKTNVGSAKVLKGLVELHPMNVHLVSTAYVCGFVPNERVYEKHNPRGDFVNVYEESKWEAEQIWKDRATVLRPSIIVGHSETGRCTSFTGWYYLFQAVHLLDRLSREATDYDRHNLNINVPASPVGAANIIPVDYVSKAAVRIIENAKNHNKVFHLTHPDPPTHQATLDLICKKFDIGGINFAGEGAPFTQPRNRIERMVWRQMQTILFYFSNNPIFDRSNTDRALADYPVPPMTDEVIHRVIDYAIEKDWGQAGA